MISFAAIVESLAAKQIALAGKTFGLAKRFSISTPTALFSKTAGWVWQGCVALDIPKREEPRFAGGVGPIIMPSVALPEPRPCLRHRR